VAPCRIIDLDLDAPSRQCFSGRPTRGPSPDSHFRPPCSRPTSWQTSLPTMPQGGSAATPSINGRVLVDRRAETGPRPDRLARRWFTRPAASATRCPAQSLWRSRAPQWARMAPGHLGLLAAPVSMLAIVSASVQHRLPRHRAWRLGRRGAELERLGGGADGEHAARTAVQMTRAATVRAAS
jgi:hypothetical protein